MTTGDPVVVRAAMKPLPDADEAAALGRHRHQGAGRRRCASAPTPARCPRPGVVGEAMVALVLAAAYREKFGGDHIDDVRGGPARLPGADRMEAGSAGQAPPAGVERRSCRGFMGAGKSTGARVGWPRSSAWQALDSDRELEQRLGEPIESFFDREGEAAFREREEEVVLELLAARRRRGGRARRRRRAVRAGARGARPPHGRAPRGRARGRLAARLGQRAARWRATRRASSSSSATAAPLYESVADAVLPPADRDALRARAARAAGARRGAAGHAAGLGRRRVGRLPGLPRPRADRVGLLPAARRARASWSPTRTSRASSAVRGRRADRGDARRGAQDARTAPSTCCARWRSGGAERGDLVVAVGGGVVGRPGRLLRGGLPARHAPRAGADHAGGAGRLRLRRQDRRRPAGGQELRGRLPPAVGGAVRPGRARHAARRGAARPATPRS